MAILRPLFSPCRLRWFLYSALALVLAPSLSLSAVDQREVQAVFLLNLTRFIKWPERAFPSEEAPFVIGILPDEPLAGLLAEAAKGENTGRHPITIRRVHRLDDIDGCHLVYLSKAGLTGFGQMLSETSTRPVLTVSDADGFLVLGGHVQLYSRAGQTKLRVDVGNLRRANLSASAPLLRLAEVSGK